MNFPHDTQGSINLTPIFIIATDLLLLFSELPKSRRHLMPFNFCHFRDSDIVQAGNELP
ncbi:uncharacterized protein B0I36DRAFT_312029 [Microdochium trichocladiopsis]|uniref:Uncharacterized protein n=1 Tax=Microdochium trichocladiopsis TaxID=1682393 RepID=A0A9P9BWZ1_9PEZI|nr:uncharacterized protein B0I36DRAFT_312029 [Microdochium trichocladiopsis]KAH7041055.1 hypothetical protein B0I36DRAFT_312029 [Microdochium trichocladiopsis]